MDDPKRERSLLGSDGSDQLRCGCGRIVPQGDRSERSDSEDTECRRSSGIKLRTCEKSG